MSNVVHPLHAGFSDREGLLAEDSLEQASEELENFLEQVCACSLRKTCLGTQGFMACGAPFCS